MGKIIIIACINQSLTLGNNNTLLYKIKDDLRNFKQNTINNTILMGKKTFDSLPIKPLPKRNNIIITHDQNYNCDNCIICQSIEDGIKYWKEHLYNTDLFIIGGSSIYRQVLDKDIADEMIITLVFDYKDGDAKFPDYMKNKKWHEIYSSPIMYDEIEKLSYQYITYKNIK